MLVKEVMTCPAITVRGDTSIKDGLKVLDEHRVTSLPVTDGRGRILGVVSESDLLRDAVHPDPRRHMRAGEEEPGDRPRTVGEVMSTRSMTVTADADLSEAVELMTGTAVKSLPVVEGRRVVGVVSRSDVVHLLARSDERIRGEVDEMLRSAGLECEVYVDEGVVSLDGPADPGGRRIAEVMARSVPGVLAVQARG